ncbi:hypothetical protein HY772_02170 [Candidatus Woesearchaeota archaeon]|nr:hypothetical protein [Candidatus Woesearchaeota archaeon]
MALNETRFVQYGETHIVKYELDFPGFEGVEFTESSKEVLTWPAAVKFAADQNSVLQSVREVGAFRIEAEEKDDADRYQATRTCAVYFKDGSNFYVAFDDAPEASQNIILERVQEDYDAAFNGREWILPKTDRHIAQILKRAEKSDRVIPVVESLLELMTKASTCSSEFGSNDTVQALLGDVAEPYARMLHKRDYHKGLVYLLTLSILDKHVDAQSALVRPVGVGCVSFFSVVGVDLFDVGRARGVRNAHNFHRKQK